MMAKKGKIYNQEEKKELREWDSVMWVWKGPDRCGGLEHDYGLYVCTFRSL